MTEMNIKLYSLLLWISSFFILTLGTKEPRPHIIFILGDDLGWMDFSFHGSDQIATPNIDSMAYDGIVIQNYHTEAVCTPARTALLTGKYPSMLGMQGFPLINGEDRGIPMSERLLPQYLQSLGYATHIVGKWHLGMSRSQYLPTNRGFQSHLGYRGGFIDYYEYEQVEKWPQHPTTGFDFYRNTTPAYDLAGNYVTDLFTEHSIELIKNHNASQPLFLYLAHLSGHAGNDGGKLQAPTEEVAKQRHITNAGRKSYAAMVSKLDESVGRVVEALGEQGMLENSIVIFASDNGAPTIDMYSNNGLNLPFRGIKDTPWQGGLRVPFIIWSPQLRGGKTWDGFMHVTDVLPTLISAAGGTVPKNLDGRCQWNSIKMNKKSQRREALVFLNDQTNVTAYRLGDYKIVLGNLLETPSNFTAKYLLENDKPRNFSYQSSIENSLVKKALERLGRNINTDNINDLRRQYSNIRELNKNTTLCVPDGIKPCLFDLSKDPTEKLDIAAENPEIVSLMVSRVQYYWKKRIPRKPIELDSAADPKYHNYTWSPWLKDNCNETKYIKTFENDDSNFSESKSEESIELPNLLITNS